MSIQVGSFSMDLLEYFWNEYDFCRFSRIFFLIVSNINVS